jgi:hypothetical protein
MAPAFDVLGFLVVGAVIAGRHRGRFTVGLDACGLGACGLGCGLGVAITTPPNGASSQPTPPSSKLPAALQDTW